MDLGKLLNGIGMAVFVKYYYDFKGKENQECISIIEEMYTQKSKSGRTSKAKKIFRDDLQIDALHAIINSNRIDDSVIKRAKEILREEADGGC